MSNNTPKPFSADSFTDTQFHTAEDKAKFGNDLVRFILNGFKWSDFTGPVYSRLSNCFGHIAHYNRLVFFDTWFSEPRQIREWLDWVAGATPVGSASHTFSDFERAFQVWIRENRTEIQSVIEDGDEAKQALSDAKGDTVQFVVVAISKNTGAFGHKRHILVGRNGVAFDGDRQPAAHAPGNEDLREGQTFEWEVDAEGMPVERHKWFEHTSKRPEPVPDAVIEEAFAQTA